MESRQLLPNPLLPDSACDPAYHASDVGSASPPQHDEARGTANRAKPPPWAHFPTLHVHHVDRDAVHFGIRMAVCMAISSLFVLVQSPGDGARYPQGMWVLITVLFVCWFPGLDAASVIEKCIQRLIGTMIGAALGLICGFLSLAVMGHSNALEAQAIFLVCCIGAITFLICWSAVQFKIGGTRLIAKYNYACILCLLTFTICLLPFYSDEEKKWVKSVYRVINVIVGCFLGALLAISILPRSTVCILREKIQTQIKLAGEASEAVLHTAADSFSESAYAPLAMADEMLESPGQLKLRRSMSRPWRKCKADLGSDVALEKYELAIKEWRATKSQLSMLKYDPFNVGTPVELLAAFRTETANTMARALRIQNTVVLLDGIIRNDPKHDFSDMHLELFADIGTLIRHMLTVPIHLESNEEAAKNLEASLAKTRGFIIELSLVVASSSQEMPAREVGTLGVGILSSRLDLAGMLDHEDDGGDAQRLQEDDKGGRGAPKFVHGSRVCALLFLQLVEHLTLRSIRLYQSWKQCDGIYRDAERLDEGTKGRRYSSFKWKGF